MRVNRSPWAEEWLYAATHAFGAFLGAVGLVLLIIQADDVGRTGSLPAAFTAAGRPAQHLHHAASQPRIKQLLLALDHGGIYLLIAGTYTPFCLLLPPGQEWTLLAFIWGLALAGITVQWVAFLTGRIAGYERFAFVFYLAMGWIPMLWASGDVSRNLVPAGLALLVAGGIAYSIGVIFYLWKRLPYGHAAWHLFVVAGSSFHFLSIFYYVVPEAL